MTDSGVCPICGIDDDLDIVHETQGDCIAALVGVVEQLRGDVVLLRAAARKTAMVVEAGGLLFAPNCREIGFLFVEGGRVDIGDGGARRISCRKPAASAADDDP